MKRTALALFLLCNCILLVSCSFADKAYPISTSTKEVASMSAQSVRTGGGATATASNTPGATQAGSANVAWNGAVDGVGGVNNVNMNRLTGKPDMCDDAHGDIMVSDGSTLYVYQRSTGIISRADIGKCRILNATTAVTAEGADAVSCDNGNLVGMGILDKDHLCIVTVLNLEDDRDNPYMEASKALMFKKDVTDADATLEKLGEFYIRKGTKCVIVGSWCYYETSTVQYNTKEKRQFGARGLERRSMMDGTVQKIIEYDYNADPVGDIQLTFAKNCLLYTVKERDAATGKGNWVTRKMDLVTGQSEVVPFLKEGDIVAVYDGYIYYVGYPEVQGSTKRRQALLRVPQNGGAPEMVIDSLEGTFDSAKFNFANNTIYFLWQNSLLYRVPLGRIGVSRYDVPYVKLYAPVKNAANIAPDVSGGLWIWDGTVWVYNNMDGTHPQLSALENE